MNVRKQIVVALVSLGTPLAAFAAAPASAGQVEAAERSGELAPSAAAPTPDLSRRVHELVVNGASYNEAPVRAAQEREIARAAAPSQPTREDVEQGAGYTPSSYAALAPTRG
jgi:hypothetical protein